MATLVEAEESIRRFMKGPLRDHISVVESSLQGRDRTACQSQCQSLGITQSLLDSALLMKRTASQTDTLIHAVGILISLPVILRKGETIKSLSLGAGNTGRQFDLETNFRIAEFKFINWRGGSESVRQNSLFKDFYQLAEHSGDGVKERCLYVLGTEYPLRFLRGKRCSEV